MRPRSTAVALAALVLPAALHAQVPIEPAQAPTWALELNGDWLFGDAPLSGGGAGTLHVLHRTATGWAPVQTLTSTVGPLSEYGNAIASDGDFLAVGAPGEGLGRVYVYRLSGGAWQPFQEIGAASPAGYFGHQLALTGDRLLIAATRYVPGLPVQRQVFVFAFDGAQWTPDGTLLPPDDQPFGSTHFGRSVAVDGDLAVVGEPEHPPIGRAVVYRRGPAGWAIEAVLAPPGADGIGDAVAIHDGRVLIGAPRTDLLAPGSPSAGFLSGRVYAFELLGSTWTEVQRLEPLGPEGSTYWQMFGGELELSGSLLAVGPEDVSDVQDPTVHLYRHDGTAYVLEATVEAPVGIDGFGQRLAFDGSTLAAGGYPQSIPSYDVTDLGLALQAWPPSASLSAGGSQGFALTAGPAAEGDFFVLLGSLSGSAPGVGIGGTLLPLNPDAYLTLTAKLAGPLHPHSGVLGPLGQGAASLVLPPGLPAALAGTTVHHAYLAIDLATAQVRLASNAAAVLLEP